MASASMASDETEASSRPRDPADFFDFPLARQNSIYSLTLDEIQNAVLEPAGKSFGSMNMDDFLANIWSAEEAVAAAPPAAAPPALRRQGSLTAPALLSRKTVDEVWAQIHRGPDPPPPKIEINNNTETAPRQPTLGEMTLEDFLVKAGVVRDSYDTVRAAAAAAGPQQAVEFAVGPAANGGYHQMGVGNGFGVVGPASPGSSEAEGRYAKDETESAGGGGARKRAAPEGGVEKVVERRQRRMIKNRESAARSRARKQAYTVELEAELNHLKEENSRLKEEEKRMLVLRKQLLLRSMNDQAHSNSVKTVRTLRRVNSCTW